MAEFRRRFTWMIVARRHPVDVAVSGEIQSPFRIWSVQTPGDSAGQKLGEVSTNEKEGSLPAGRRARSPSRSKMVSIIAELHRVNGKGLFSFRRGRQNTQKNWASNAGTTGTAYRQAWCAGAEQMPSRRATAGVVS